MTMKETTRRIQPGSRNRSFIGLTSRGGGGGGREEEEEEEDDVPVTCSSVTNPGMLRI